MAQFKNVYSDSQSESIAKEFTRLKDECYLEHAGATLYSETQISNVLDDLKTNTYGNPHAYNTSSKYTGDTIDQIRYKVLEFFGTTSDDYSVVFTSGATSALKIVAETFDYQNGTFVYLEDNHTSVLGMREYAPNIYRLRHDEAFDLFNKNHNCDTKFDENSSLFVYPAQCNFSGTKYPLSWIKKVKNGVLNRLENVSRSKWYCMLDAASFVSTNPLNLQQYQPDFVCVSFYKIFGYPAGLGALLVNNNSGNVLKKRYFGGGTVQVTLPKTHVFRITLHEKFEDGTVSFLSIISLRHGFETFKRLKLSMELVSKHTFSLAKYVHDSLLSTCHANENPVAVLYHDTTFETATHQGGILNFNLLRDNGDYIGYSQVLHIANLYRIHFRTGCLCNPGACQRLLKLSIEDVKYNFQAGHVCGDQNDLIDGRPTGSIRVSFGYMSTKNDAETLIKMIRDCFVTKPIVEKLPPNWEKFVSDYNKKFVSTENVETVPKKIFQSKNVTRGEVRDTILGRGVLGGIFIYPVKSCGAFSIPSDWTIGGSGLEFDRNWMIVTSTGVCLTQKNNPKMCLIRPKINKNNNVLELHYPDVPSVTVPLVTESVETEVEICQSKVCGDRVKCYDCGDEVADWISECLQRSDLRLLQQTDCRTNKKGNKTNLSLVNEAQYLLLNVASVKYLSRSIPVEERKGLKNLIERFRANFVIMSEDEFIESISGEVHIGKLIFQCVGPCTRCQMICIDQETSEKSVEPLKTLSTLMEGKIRFGVYLQKSIETENDKISIGEKVIFK